MINGEKEKSGLQTTYEYTLFEDDVLYHYEEPYGGQPELMIMDTYSETSKNIEIQTLDGFIDDGVGGRQKIIKSGSYLSSSLQLPLDSQVNPVGGAYNYAGFSAPNFAADMGLQYDTSVGPNDLEKGWKPALIMKKFTNGAWIAQSVGFVNPYLEVQYKNAFLSGSTVVVYVWYNNNGKVRLKLEGTATCADRSCNSAVDTNLISIYESATSHNISSIDYWKVLSTVISNNDTGKNKAIYSSIRIDGILVPSSAFQTPEVDHSKITRDASNKVTITVDSSLY